MFLITEILIIYYHYTKNVRILVQLQTSESGRCTFSVINYAKHLDNKNTSSQQKKPLGINFNGSAGNSHSHWGGFPFPPIPSSVFYSHSRGIPMGFPVPLGIPFPCTSVVCRAGLCRSCEVFGVSKLVISSLRAVDECSFENLSASSHKWLHIDEVRTYLTAGADLASIWYCVLLTGLTAAARAIGAKFHDMSCCLGLETV